MLPTSSNCSVHGIHLGDDQAQVLDGVGKPDGIENFYPKAREDVTVWTWGKATAPNLPTLQVFFEKSRVTNIWGTSLSVGCKDYDLDAGMPAKACGFLGTPVSCEAIEWLGESRVDNFTTWKFPELSITMVSRESVNQVRIERP